MRKTIPWRDSKKLLWTKVTLFYAITLKNEKKSAKQIIKRTTIVSSIPILRNHSLAWLILLKAKITLCNKNEKQEQKSNSINNAKSGHFLCFFKTSWK